MAHLIGSQPPIAVQKVVRGHERIKRTDSIVKVHITRIYKLSKFEASQRSMSGRGKVTGSGKARAKAKTRSSKAGLQFPVVYIRSCPSD